jgi:heptosyltransferase-2
MPNWIGDLVMATPVLADLRTAFPDAHITAMCRTPHSTLLQEDPSINELFSFNKSGHRQHKKELVQRIREGKYDLGILLTNSFSSAWWFWHGKVLRLIGYTGQLRSPLLTDRVPPPDKLKSQHLVLSYKMLLAPLAIPNSDTVPCLYLTSQELEAARERLTNLSVGPHQTIVGINPGAAYGSAKCWLPERFREVTEKLLEDPSITILYFGDHNTAPLIQQICENLPPRVINLAGLTSIRELACLIKLCDTLLTNDSGPMHIAAAVGTPLVALFGSTNDKATGPYKTGIVIHKHVSCSPCYKRVCPIDFRCMKRIEVKEVLENILTSLPIHHP